MADQFTPAELNALMQDPSLSVEERREVAKMLQEMTQGQIKAAQARGPKENIRNVAKGLGDTAALAGGFVPGPFRFPIIGGGRAISEFAETGSPLQALESGMQDMLLEGVMTGIPVALRKGGKATFKGLQEHLPKGATALGLKIGGAKDPETIRKGAEGITAEWRRGRPILPGAEQSVRSRLEALGPQARAVSDKATTSIHIDDIADAAEQDVRKRLLRPGANRPIDETQAALDQIEEFALQNRQLNKSGWFSPTQIGDIKKAQIERSLDLPGSIHEPAPTSKIASRAVGNAAREAQNLAAPDIIPLNKRMSDLYGIQEANEAVRGNTAWFSPRNLMKGAGAGATLGYFAGIPVQEAMALGAAGSALALNPKTLTILGQAGGPAAGITPTAARLMELIEGLDEDPEETVF